MIHRHLKSSREMRSRAMSSISLRVNVQDSEVGRIFGDTMNRKW